jgi:endonuclease YncB( thermonuclease family)
MSIEDFRQFGGSTPELSINGVKSYGRLVDIYDGDSVKVILPVFGSYYKFTIRLDGIDTCEIRSKDTVLQEYAIKARGRLFELLTANTPYTKVYTKIDANKDIKKLLDAEVYLVWVECGNKDKYGRILANIYKDKASTQSVSSILLEEKLAYRYEGKTKLTDDMIKKELNIT